MVKSQLQGEVSIARISIDQQSSLNQPESLRIGGSSGITVLPSVWIGLVSHLSLEKVCFTVALKLLPWKWSI